ncbi:MAG: hypothetical protein JWS12_597 [Candidatus Saccharibacteria bacterium]|nr:hypothetical protein [Candidatus Saccharibacteria bacterium]
MSFNEGDGAGVVSVGKRMSKWRAGSLFILIFGVVGTGLLLLTHALSQSTPYKASSVAFASQDKPDASNANPASFFTKGSDATAADAKRSYLKFVVPAQPGNSTITKATLKLYTQTASTTGFSIKQIDSNWDPATVTYKTAPTPGNIIGSTTSTTANGWASVDLSTYVKAPGTYSVAVWPKDTHLIGYSNSADTAPQLVVEVNAAADTLAPTDVKIVIPKEAETVKGRVNFDGTASDNTGITNYEFFVDGKSVGTAKATIYGYVIYDAAAQNYGYDSAKLTDGAHIIYSVASDAAGNKTQSASVNFTVQNTTPPPPPPGGGPYRATFYYPWFPETWGSDLSKPFTNYHPIAGYYSSDDAAVVSKHITQMTYAGFDTAIASWWGQTQHKENTRVPALLNNANNNSNNKKLKWALYYEKESTGDPSVSAISGDLTYIKTNYANNANYLKINNKPVIFVFTDGGDSCAMSQRWHDANATAGFYVVLKVFGNYLACSPQPDGWHQYGPAGATDSQGKYSYTISPGFYKKGDPAARLPRLDNATWSANIDKMTQSGAQFQLVTTFNEWGEGSAVEPADGVNGWASASGYGMYIDALHQKLNNTGGGGGDTTAPSVPSGLTANAPTGGPAVVNLSWSGSTDTGGSGLKGYELYRDSNLLTTLSTTTYSDTTVAFGTRYSYFVKAIDNAGNRSAASNIATATPTAPTDTTPPSTPGNLAASLPVPTGKTVHLSWAASVDTGGSGLKNYVLARNGVVIASPGATATSYDDTSTIFATAYSYTLAAVDNAGNTSAAASVSISTPAAPADTQAPDVPAATATVVSPTQVTIKWNAVADNPKSGNASGVKGYKVFRDGAQVADVATPSTSTNDGPFNFVSGQTYRYTALAYDVAGNTSAQSTASSVIPNPVVVSGANCGNTSTGNKIDTVVVIAEENRSWSNVGGPGFSASTMPYTHAVAAQCAYFQLDTEVNTGDNSAQQYVGAWTGADASITHVSSDCSPSSSCSFTGNNIFRVFRNASIPHREYVEGTTGTCSASGNAAKHIPELYMWDATDKANCNAEVLPMSQFNFATPPTGYTFITPTLCNDGHDCSDNTVDNWLSNTSRLPALFNSSAYKSGRVLVELWYDEDHPKPNLFACWSCKHVSSATDPHYSGESLLWLNLLGAPSGNLGGISGATDIRSIIGTP